jgi:hypothetical protein
MEFATLQRKAQSLLSADYVFVAAIVIVIGCNFYFGPRIKQEPVAMQWGSDGKRRALKCATPSRDRIFYTGSDRGRIAFLGAANVSVGSKTEVAPVERHVPFTLQERTPSGRPPAGLKVPTSDMASYR